LPYPTVYKRTLANLRRVRPVKLLLVGYLSYALLGWLLLCLPVTHGPEPVGALDALFTAASAMSTTGLITVNTPLAYGFWGELVILILIQLGGIGYMTLGSFVILAGTHRLSRFREQMAATAFTLPEGFRPAAFVRNVVLFTLAIEAVGAALLFFAFLDAGVGPRGQAGDIGASFSGLAHVAWQATFHSVSAFCTAGFSLFPDSLEAYRDHAWINLIISALSICGALGFIVLSDLAASLSGVRRRVTLTTRVIVQVTCLVIVLGTAFLFLAEPSITQLPSDQRLMAAWFQSMTALTTVGFNTHPIGALSAAPVLMMFLLMIIGASPSGTGGGIKTTSVSAVAATVVSVLRGRDRVLFFGHPVPTYRLHAAFATIGLYVALLFAGCVLLLLTEPVNQPDAAWAFEDYLFEATSALGTVGLSRGVTGELSDLGKLVVIALMLIGRVGPLTFSLALLGRDAQAPPDAASARPDDLAV
jgi:trk system potassium uptake protein TrkH